MTNLSSISIVLYERDSPNRSPTFCSVENVFGIEIHTPASFSYIGHFTELTVKGYSNGRYRCVTIKVNSNVCYICFTIKVNSNECYICYIIKDYSY